MDRAVTVTVPLDYGCRVEVYGESQWGPEGLTFHVGHTLCGYESAERPESVQSALRRQLTLDSGATHGCAYPPGGSIPEPPAAALSLTLSVRAEGDRFRAVVRDLLTTASGATVEEAIRLAKVQALRRLADELECGDREAIDSMAFHVERSWTT